MGDFFVQFKIANTINIIIKALVAWLHIPPHKTGPQGYQATV